MGEETDSGPSKTVADKNLVRTDAKEQKLDKFITATPRVPQQAPPNVEVVDLESGHSAPKKRLIGPPEQGVNSIEFQQTVQHYFQQGV